jgi:LmbE family N-acetylglucosaminyl deacetylase
MKNHSPQRHGDTEKGKIILRFSPCLRVSVVKWVFVTLLLVCAGLAQQPRTLLAVFAHPDDETFAGPVLARYAREGAKVYLAIATKGEKGTNDRAGIPGGDPLAKVRREEAACACRQLGIEPPIFFELNDGELGAMTNPLGRNVQSVADKLQEQIAKLHPRVIITWGPEGGYGHPDHRLVSDAVTQVIQSERSDVKLFYAGMSPEQARTLNTVWGSTGFYWHASDPAYLPVRVSVTKADLTAYHRALECHKSQFAADEMQKLEKALDAAWEHGVLFRPWFGNQQSNDLFK